MRVFLFFLFFVSVLKLAGQELIILDTDPSYDPDDAGCMAMLHTMATLGECHILAMINSIDHKEAPMAISAINTFYNRRAIPVGDYKGYGVPRDAEPSTYDYHVANTYPHDIPHYSDALDGTALYREILSGAADKSITVIIIGTMHNFYALLKSGPDLYSSLSGPDLVEQKVKQVVTMGGNFIDGKGLDRTNWGGADSLCSYTEWSCLNEERNRMCRYVIENCPAPFVASGWEVGCGDYHNANYGNVISGPALKKLDTTHIIRRSYEYHFWHRENKTDISRHSNDQCALHYAVRGEGANYQAFLGGDIDLSTGGVCTWTEGAGVQGYIQKKRDKDEIAAEIEELMMGEVPELDDTPPAKPTDLSYSWDGNTLQLTWSPVIEETPGSWVIGYDIYRDGEWVNRSYGSRYQGVVKEDWGKGKFTVQAINASGVAGKASKIKVKK